jgi:hypothetical protein
MQSTPLFQLLLRDLVEAAVLVSEVWMHCNWMHFCLASSSGLGYWGPTYLSGTSPSLSNDFSSPL